MDAKNSMPEFEIVSSGKIFFDSSSNKVAHHETTIQVDPAIVVYYQVDDIGISHKLKEDDAPIIFLRDAEKCAEIAKLVSWPGRIHGAEVISDFTLGEKAIEGTLNEKYLLGTPNGGSISIGNVSKINGTSAVRAPAKYTILYEKGEPYKAGGPSTRHYLEPLTTLHQNKVLSVVEEMSAFWRQSRGL